MYTYTNNCILIACVCVRSRNATQQSSPTIPSGTARICLPYSGDLSRKNQDLNGVPISPRITNRPSTLNPL